MRKKLTAVERILKAALKVLSPTYKPRRNPSATNSLLRQVEVEHEDKEHTRS